MKVNINIELDIANINNHNTTLLAILLTPTLNNPGQTKCQMQSHEVDEKQSKYIPGLKPKLNKMNTEMLSKFNPYDHPRMISELRIGQKYLYMIKYVFLNCQNKKKNFNNRQKDTFQIISELRTLFSSIILF